tara:strand:+ start:10706 stop:11458 length:753 start_codon:yes stop_codon:yes gene_type:complete
MMRINVIFLLLLILTTACIQDSGDNVISTVLEKKNDTASTKQSQKVNYQNLQNIITYGRANLHEVRQALTDTDPASLSNTIHALYAMRWHRGVLHLLIGAWELDRQKYPELAWEQLAKAPARIALASTINRIKIVETDEQVNFIRSHKHDEHEFHRAQVSIALGFNGAIEDIDYLKEMANADNHYVTQSAITGLGLMGGDQARAALVDLWKQHRGTSKGDLAEDLLLKAYKVIPSTEKPDSDITTKNSAK